MTPQLKIEKAKDATARIDRDLSTIVEQLQRIGIARNGVGIYSDVPSFRSDLRDVFIAIASVDRMVMETDWPTEEDYYASPPRISVRIFDSYRGRCQCGCNRPIRPVEAWDCEDTVAIINGGERRENNLKPLLAEHHAYKTMRDVAEKSRSIANSPTISESSDHARSCAGGSSTDKSS